MIQLLKDYAMIVVGAAIMAAALNIFMIPNKIVAGGASGISTVAYYVSGGLIPVGVGILIINIPLYVLCLIKLGFKAITKSLVGVVAFSLAIDFSEPFFSVFVSKYLPPSTSGSIPTDMMVYAVFGGIFMGAGLGLVLRAGGSTGGSDLAARLFKSRPTGASFGVVLFVVDTVVIVLATAAFKDFLVGMYAIVSLYVSSKVIDAIVDGLNYAKAVYIVSNHAHDISDRILNELRRGVTGLKGTGMYTGYDREVLFCVVKRGEVALVKRIAMEVDRDAFIVVSEAREVLGEGFLK